MQPETSAPQKTSSWYLPVYYDLDFNDEDIETFQASSINLKQNPQLEYYPAGLGCGGKGGFFFSLS